MEYTGTIIKTSPKGLSRYSVRLLSATLALVLLLTGSLAIAPPSPVQAALVWTAKSPMIYAGGSGGVAVAGNGRVYYVGGSNSPGWTGNQEYDPASDTWRTVATMPTGRYSLGAAAGPDGKVYAIGGWRWGWYTGVTEAYDPVTNTWASKASLNTARQELVAVTATSGIIYAIGGTYYEPYIALNLVEAYNPVANTWTTKAPMPTARWWHAAAAASNGKIYVIGGYDGRMAGSLGSGRFDPAGILNTVEEYDPASNTWTTKAPMPTLRAGLTAVATPDGKIYAIGGFYGATIFDWSTHLRTVEVYDTATNTWTTETPITTPRVAPRGALAGGTIYVLDGYTSSGATNTVEATGVAPPTGAVSWWKLDEGSGIRAQDSSDGNNGTISGAAWATGKVGGALSFDGVNDYVEVPNNSNLNPSQLTVEAWINKGNAPMAYAAIVKKAGEGGAQQNGYALELASGTAAIKFWVFLQGYGWRGTPQFPVSAGDWYHVAGTYDGAVIRLYVNGGLIGNTWLSGSIVPSSNPLRIGDDPANPGSRRFKGLIDEVKVYNRALSMAEIQANYQAGGKADTSTGVTSSQNPSTYGQSVAFTATVSVVPPGAGIPTGTVQFKIDGSNYGAPVALSGGSATSGPTSALTLGSHTITAVYSGDASFNGSTSPNLTQTVNKAPATVILGNLNQTYTGSALTPSATTTPVGLTITWTGAPQTNAGSYPVTATVSDPNYTGSASDTFIIAKANQTITFGPLADKVYGDADFTVSATASSGLAVSFTASGAATLSGNTVHITGLGSATITAHQSGNSNYNAAPDVSRTFTVIITYDRLADLVRQFVTKPGIVNSLLAKLDNARKADARGDASAKAGMIGAFINEVQAQAGKSISPENAALLILLAQAL